MNAELVILTLKIAVSAVTVLLLASLVALSRGNYRLHGRINRVVFVLTILALLGLELIAQLIDRDLFHAYLERHHALTHLYIHLGFSVPATLLLMAMLFTGLRHYRKVHIALGLVFLLFWAGTFITGVFFLPHTP